MKRKRLAIIVLSVAGLCLFTFCILNASLRSGDYTAAQYAESAQYLDNPYVGWYQIYIYRLSDVELPNFSAIENQSYGPALLLLEIDLQNYQDCPLSSEAVSQLDALLSVCRLKGKQLIIRFMYDSEGHAIIHEPADIAIIKMHMSQAAEIINQYTDCVYIIQGLFMGAWGEMHTSNYTDWDSILTLAGHLNAVTDPSIFLAVRTPDQWRAITQSSAPLTSSQAFDGSLASRLSLFNDGILGSETDLGTYAETGTVRDSQYIGKLDRQAEILFQNRLCNYVPNGGETVIDNPYNDFYSAASYADEVHLSYLNSGYDQAVLDKWTKTAYEGEGPYSGMNGYDYIGCHMGYRYAVRSSSFNILSTWNETAEFSVQIENVGFSSAYRAFDVSVLLRNRETDEEYTIPVKTDTRMWNTSQPTVLNIPLQIRDCSLGTYDVFLRMYDPLTHFDVYFANEGAYTSAGLLLGTLTIRPIW